MKVEVKATGYRTYEKKLDLVGDEMTLEIELSKRPSSGTGGGVHPPKRPDRPPSGGGGLDDILAFDGAGGETADQILLQHVERDHHRHARDDRAGGEQAVVRAVLGRPRLDEYRQRVLASRRS